jgi:hypothetical protein
MTLCNRMWKHLPAPAIAVLGVLLSAAICYGQSAPPTLPDHTVYGRLGSGTGSGPGQAIPFSTLFYQLGQVPGLNTTPKFARYSALSGFTTITLDTNTTLVNWIAVGGGGGGSGNTSSNRIPYSQYGGIGGVTALGITSVTPTFSGSPSTAVVTTPAQTAAWACNLPFYFANNGDTLPTGLSFNTVYYVYCGSNGNGTGTGASTTTTLEISSALFMAPFTCAVYNAGCQTALTISSSDSGTHVMNYFNYVALPGSGGGVVGDQANPGSYIGCDANGNAGYVQSFGLQGGAGSNIYGWNISGGNGGANMFGGSGVGSIGIGGGSPGTNETGAGGAGAGALVTASGGGGGGSGGVCWGSFRPNGVTSLVIMAGGGGAAGTAGADAVTISHASPAVITLAGHQFTGNSAFTLSGITGAGGFLPSTNYYVCNDASLQTNSFTASSTVNCANPVNTSATGSATLNSGGVGFAGGNGSLMLVQYKGLE